MAQKYELDVKSTTSKFPSKSRKEFTAMCKGVKDDTFFGDANWNGKNQLNIKLSQENLNKIKSNVTIEKDNKYELSGIVIKFLLSSKKRTTGSSSGVSKKISIDTAQQEKITALIFEQVLNKKTKAWKTFEKMYDDPKSGLKKIHPKLKVVNYKDDDWWRHFDLQFNEIDQETKLPSNHFEIFNRDGGFMNFISNLVTTNYKFGQKDSWNPADIWLIDTDGQKFTNVKKKISEATTIAKVNDILKKAFLDNTIVGISLKKSRGATGTLLYEKVNLYNSAKNQQLPLIKIKYFEFDPYFENGKFLSSTSNIIFEDNANRKYKLSFRSNASGVSDITYEFFEMGMPAQIGKVPKDRFNEKLEEYNLKYPTKNDHKKFNKSHWVKSKKGATKILNKYGWKVGSRSKNRAKVKKTKLMTKEDIRKKIDSMTQDNIISSWNNFIPNLELSWEKGLTTANTTIMQMCDFIYTLSLLHDKMKQKNFERFMTDLFYYAQKKGQKWNFGPFGKLY